MKTRRRLTLLTKGEWTLKSIQVVAQTLEGLDPSTE